MKSKQKRFKEINNRTEMIWIRRVKKCKKVDSEWHKFNTEFLSDVSKDRMKRIAELQEESRIKKRNRFIGKSFYKSDFKGNQTLEQFGHQWARKKYKEDID